MFLRKISLIIRRNAGHSKWQNIRHTKALKDSQRAAMYSRFGHRIKICIQENGNNSNPETNSQLAHLIEDARKCDVPISTIQSFIKATQSDKDMAKPCRLSVKGPKGSILLVTALAKSQKKVKQDICACLNKVGGIMSDQNLEGNFNRKGIITALPPSDISNIEESSIEHAIEAGAEEVSPLDKDNKLTFFCEISQLHKAKMKLEEFNYTIDDLKITYIPKMKVSLNEDEMALMSNIISKLEENPDVVEIHDNIA